MSHLLQRGKQSFSPKEASGPGFLHNSTMSLLDGDFFLHFLIFLKEKTAQINLGPTEL